MNWNKKYDIIFSLPDALHILTALYNVTYNIQHRNMYLSLKPWDFFLQIPVVFEMLENYEKFDHIMCGQPQLTAGLSGEWRPNMRDIY